MDRKKVYYFYWPDEQVCAGLAMDCHIRQLQDGAYLCFHDTVRGHMIKGSIVNDEEGGFYFLSELCKPGIWSFKILTIDDFRNFVYREVSNGEEIAGLIQTTDDLHEWYYKNGKE